MDTKAKKRLDVINKKLQQLRQSVAGMRKQNDDPAELASMEREITNLEREAEKLRGA